MRGALAAPELALAGREIFLERYGVDVALRFRAAHGEAPVVFKNLSGAAALKAVDSGEAHAAIVTQEAPPDPHPPIDHGFTELSSFEDRPGMVTLTDRW